MTVQTARDDRFPDDRQRPAWAWAWALGGFLLFGASAWGQTGLGSAVSRALTEPHHRLEPPQAVALTLDACGGAFDQRLLALLVQHRIRATLFVTQRWIDANPQALRAVLAHPDLFELQNHGLRHVPAVLGRERRLYGMAGQPDVAALQAEIGGAAPTIQAATGRAPRYFRGAGAAYDAAGLAAIHSQGYAVAGFSVNADAGASLAAAQVAARLRRIGPGDVVLSHINHPQSGTAEGFALAIPQWKARGLVFVTLSNSKLVPVDAAWAKRETAAVGPAVPANPGKALVKTQP